MAFVSIDNPAGIQHHGGQMDWCPISPTRIAIVTFTVDNKALVQEANFAGGVTTLGPASFLKQVTVRSQTQYTHLKPRVRNLGNDRLLIMVPSTFIQTPLHVTSATQVLYGDQQYAAIYLTIDVPSAYTFMTAQRNADGTYTVDSQTDARTQPLASDISNGKTNINAPFTFVITSGQIRVRQPMITNNNTRYAFENILTLDGAGKISSQTIGAASFGAQNGSIAPIGVREALTPARESLDIFATCKALGTPYWSLWANTANGAIVREYYNTPVAEWWPNTNINGNFLNMHAFVPINISAKTFLYTGAHQTLVGGNCYLNDTLQSAGAQIVHPLDSAWVTDSVVAVIGMAGVLNVNGNPNAWPTACFDGDAACSLNPAYDANNTSSRVRRLSIAFKSLIGAGLYVGPFDPIETQYYTKDYFNVGNMIHRIDDTAFWIVGCFRDGAAGADTLGIITVKSQ